MEFFKACCAYDRKARPTVTEILCKYVPDGKAALEEDKRDRMRRAGTAETPYDVEDSSVDPYGGVQGVPDTASTPGDQKTSHLDHKRALRTHMALLQGMISTLGLLPMKRVDRLKVDPTHQPTVL